MSEKVKELSSKLDALGLKDKKQQAGVLAQIQAESNFVPRSENLNYTGAQLWKAFPKYFKSKEEAYKIAKEGEEAIANRIYGGRMGNAADEGYKYRGRGYIQITGKDNYKKYGEKIGVDLVANPDLANNPDTALKLATVYLKDRSADLTDPVKTTFAVGPVDTAKKAEERKKIYNELLGTLGVGVETDEIKKAVDEVKAPPARQYAIQQGDTFYSMAQQLGIPVQQLMTLNPGTMPSTLRIGQIVNVPNISGD
jgi:putative chitinase